MRPRVGFRHDTVDQAVAQRERCGVRSGRQGPAGEVMYDARPGKSDGCPLNREGHIGEVPDAGEHAARRWIAENGDKRDPGPAGFDASRHYFWHLREGHHSLLHARSSGCNHQHEGNRAVRGSFECARYPLSDDLAHAPSHHREIKDGDLDRSSCDAGRSGIERFTPRGLECVPVTGVAERIARYEPIEDRLERPVVDDCVCAVLDLSHEETSL
jgi:hypothetical protein